MADISKITTLDGTTYDLKDATARAGNPSAATATPLMDGTAAVGSSSKYAKEDHVHPTDTSRQATLVSGTNIKTINNESLLGSGNITIQGGSGGGINRNLLDNWYFAGGGDQQGYGHFPINSQGKTSYSKTVAAAIPAFDRWEIAGTSSAPAGAVTVSLTSAGAQITKATDGATWDLYNNIRDTEHLAGKTVTFSALITELTASTVQLCVEQYNGSYSYTYSDQFTTTGLHSVTATIASDATRISVVCILPTGTARTCTVQAVKLELGSSQTLANYDGSAWKLLEVPDYREQLERCNNYRFRNSGINENILDNWFFIGGGSQQNYKHGKFPLNLSSQTTYSSEGYTIDRWLMSSGATLTVNTYSITWNSGQVANYQQFRQYLSRTLIGGTYTISMLAKVNSVNGTVWWGLRDENNIVQQSLTITSATSGYEVFTKTFTLDGIKTGWSMGFVTSNATTDNISIDIQGMKLEAGSVQTLVYHNDSNWILREIPDYTEQQHRCWMAKTADTSDKNSNHAVGGFYKDVTQLGLTHGSATITEVWNAMAYNSVAYINHGGLASSQKPASYGTYFFFKHAGAGIIQFYCNLGTTQSIQIYVMSINSSGVPTGVWHALSQQTYSPLKDVTSASYSLVTSDMGKTLCPNYTALHGQAATFTFPFSVSTQLPIGTEIAFFWQHTSSLKLKFTGGMRTARAGDTGFTDNGTYIFPEMYSIVGLKKTGSSGTSVDYWIIQGDLEVSS